ncbi:MAG: lanthionine synthetase C family protein [Bacteroidales bacterium]
MWKPIINEKDINLILNKIYDAIKLDSLFVNDIGMLSGLAGIAQFCFYYGKYLKRDEPAEIGLNIINKIFEKIEHKYQLPTYCSGIAGAAWSIIHLSENDFLDVDCDIVLNGIDDYLGNQMNYYIANNKYDYLHGAIGIGLYFLKRFETTKNDKLKAKYLVYLVQLLSYLKETSIVDKQSDGLKWESLSGVKNDNLVYNLGLAHGIPSILYFLNRLALNGIEVNKSNTLLWKGINYLQYSKLEGNEISLYPSIISDNAKTSHSRLAWCYGDLGIGSVFSQLKITSVNEDARKIFLLSVKRTNLDENNVVDAGICHGAMGIAHIFNRQYQASDNVELKNAALYWLHKGIEMAVHVDGCAGFLKWDNTNKEWVKELCLLNGISGIGLVLISMISDIDPAWDECLLLS